VTLVLAVIGIIIGLIALSKIQDLLDREVDSPPVVDFNLTRENVSPLSKTLNSIVERGFVRCGVPREKPGFAIFRNGTALGFDADLCRAVAAAVFGESEGRVEFVPTSAMDRWKVLQNGSIDLLARGTTHTMERDVYEPSVKAGFEFSSPYLYNGLGFGGVPPFGKCADNVRVEGECADLMICVTAGTTHVPLVENIFSSNFTLQVASELELYTNLASGKCNAIAEEQTGIAEIFVRAVYDGDYEVGEKQFSKEPLAVVTREGDAYWNDFVFWVIESLLKADEQNIRRSNATRFSQTQHFGPKYRRMFQRAIRDVGSYSEIYNRNLEGVPLPRLNHMNVGNSGLIYSFPFGSLDTVGNGPIPDGTFDRIRKRGHLKCGITTRASFGEFNREKRTWSGMDVDYCRALSAAIFDGVDSHVVYVVLPATDRFLALADGQVDCLSRITTFTQQRDRVEPTTRGGFSFSPVTFYDGLSFGGVPPFGDCAGRLDVKSAQCMGLKICVNSGTTTFAFIRRLFPESTIVAQPSGAEMLENFGTECNAIGGGSHDIAEVAIRRNGYEGDYEVGSARHSKEPLAIVTREDDAQWTNFVRWVVHGTFFAEEKGFTMNNAAEMPRSNLFGALHRNFLINAVNAVGNYGEIYERNVESLVPRAGGLNEMNRGGPQRYASVF